VAIKFSKLQSSKTPARARVQKRSARRGAPDGGGGIGETSGALGSTQAELAAVRERYAELYDAAPVGFLTLTDLGNIEEINLTGARLLGFTHRQLRDQPLVVFLARADRGKFSKYLSQLRRFPGRHSVEVELARRKSTPRVFIEVVANSAPGQTDGPLRFQGVLIDITARRAAESALRESEERFRTLAGHAPVAIFWCDAKGDNCYVNDAWCAMTGFSAEQARGRGWLDAVQAEDRPRLEAGWIEALRDGATAVEFRFRRPDGGVVWANLQGVPLKNAAGECTGCIGTVTDITDRRRSEAETKRANEEILAASRAKDDFLAMLSHELRTPLNPVLLLAGDAARNRDLPPGVRADFDAIRRNIEMEARLIDDLLDITRITHGKLTLEKQALEVHDVLRSALAMVESDIERKKIHLKLALTARRQTVLADPVRLQQVFLNLLKNAIKFTPENGDITVETSAAGADLEIKITDTGVGIAPADLETIFEAFSQAGQAGWGGLGLGLAISRKLVEMHSGSIRATSAGRQRGASFCITLPVIAAPKAAARSERPAPGTPPLAASGAQPTRRSRILLVEDHEPTRAALTRLLLRRRFEVTGAGSVAEARSFADEAKPGFDLVISDIALPDGNGYDLMNELREEHHLEGIALTGYGMEEDVQRSFEAGFATHLTKPVKIESLDQALDAILHRP
jgi:PAS domain S-box-containing protein